MLATPTVFISYSHQDREWKDRLVGHLKVLEFEGKFRLWEDGRIGAGDNWESAIMEAMEAARLVVILISKDALTSPFMRRRELPRILERHEKDGVGIVPVLVEHCPWEEVDWLRALQVHPLEGKPLSDFDNLDSELKTIALEVKRLAVAQARQAEEGLLIPTKLKPRPPASLPPLPAEPYPLLSHYTHPAAFTGRSGFLIKARRALERSLLVCLHARSGTGKSSFLTAGLVPALRRDGYLVALGRRPDEAGLVWNLLRDLAVLPESFAIQSSRVSGAVGAVGGGREARQFASAIAQLGEVSGKPPILILDQFEDTLHRRDQRESLAYIGPLLAATARKDLPKGQGAVCRWVLCYRQEYHGAVVEWLNNVLRESRALGLSDLEGLPANLKRPDYFQELALPPFGDPGPAADGEEVARRAFCEAILAPLRLRNNDATPRYTVEFVCGEAEKLAAAFATERLMRPRAPLTPELQVVLHHLLRTASLGPNGSRVVTVGPDPASLISHALRDHLRQKLGEAYRGEDRKVARRRRTQAILALLELASDQGQRAHGVSDETLRHHMGVDAETLLERLTASEIRLLVPEEDEAGGELRYVLPHDSLAKAVVELFEDPKTRSLYDLDEELVDLRKNVGLLVQLHAADPRAGTALDEGLYQRIRQCRQELPQDPVSETWWQACVAKRKAKRRKRRISVAAVLLALTMAAPWSYWQWQVSQNRAQLVERLETADRNQAFQAFVRLSTEYDRDPGYLGEVLRKRNQGDESFSWLLEEAWGVPEMDRNETMLQVVEAGRPLLLEEVEAALGTVERKSQDRLEFVSIALWSLDRFPLRDSNLEVRRKAWQLRAEIVTALRKARPELPALEEDVWVGIEGGHFLMGSDEIENAPTHPVHVSDFEILRHEVTHADFRPFLPDLVGDGLEPEETARLPVVNVTWYEAYTYAAWLGGPDQQGRLPTEAEWEYAARGGGRDQDYPWGDEPMDCERAVFADCVDEPLLVCSRPLGHTPPPHELCDMAGNVWEWVGDWNGPYDAGSHEVANPWGPATGRSRVVRGGSLFKDARLARAAYRYWRQPQRRYPYRGFRVLLPSPRSLVLDQGSTVPGDREGRDSGDPGPRTPHLGRFQPRPCSRRNSRTRCRREPGRPARSQGFF